MSVPAGSREVAGMFGVYTVGSGLGKGAQGRVKLGTHQETGRVRNVLICPCDVRQCDFRSCIAASSIKIHPKIVSADWASGICSSPRVGAPQSPPPQPGSSRVSFHVSLHVLMSSASSAS